MSSRWSDNFPMLFSVFTFVGRGWQQIRFVGASYLAFVQNHVYKSHSICHLLPLAWDANSTLFLCIALLAFDLVLGPDGMVTLSWDYRLCIYGRVLT